MLSLDHHQVSREQPRSSEPESEPGFISEKREWNMQLLAGWGQRASHFWIKLRSDHDTRPPLPGPPQCRPHHECHRPQLPRLRVREARWSWHSVFRTVSRLAMLCLGKLCTCKAASERVSYSIDFNKDGTNSDVLIYLMEKDITRNVYFNSFIYFFRSLWLQQCSLSERLLSQLFNQEQ